MQACAHSPQRTTMSETPPPINTDYFMSETHEGRVKNAIDREMAKMSAQADVDNLFAVSDAIGTLLATCAFLRATGLKTLAVDVLKRALQFSRKGPEPHAPRKGV